MLAFEVLVLVAYTSHTTRTYSGWLMLIYSERKMLSVDWWIIYSERKILSVDWWMMLICSERKISPASGWNKPYEHSEFIRKNMQCTFHCHSTHNFIPLIHIISHIPIPYRIIGSKSVGGKEFASTTYHSITISLVRGVHDLINLLPAAVALNILFVCLFSGLSLVPLNSTIIQAGSFHLKSHDTIS